MASQPAPAQGSTPTRASQSRSERFVRHGHRVRLYAGAGAFVALLAILIVLVTKNEKREAGLGRRLDARVPRLDRAGCRRDRVVAGNRDGCRLPLSDAAAVIAPAVWSHRHDEAAVRERAVKLAAATLQEARRARNRRLAGVENLRCEYPGPTCRATLPAAAEAHRRGSEHFIVVPEHAAGETVIAVADRFFVVEPRKAGRTEPQRGRRRSPTESTVS